jgi:hypothetical protein
MIGSSKQEREYQMEVNLRKEHEDGSATYTFDMNDEERCSLLRLGIITALERGIEASKKYQDDTEYTDEQSPATD